jgi:hypothetical protein
MAAKGEKKREKRNKPTSTFFPTELLPAAVGHVLVAAKRTRPSCHLRCHPEATLVRLPAPPAHRAAAGGRARTAARPLLLTASPPGGRTRPAARPLLLTAPPPKGRAPPAALPLLLTATPPGGHTPLAARPLLLITLLSEGRCPLVPELPLPQIAGLPVLAVKPTGLPISPVVRRHCSAWFLHTRSTPTRDSARRIQS